MTRPVPVLISSRGRALYLWACLDALYRCTHHPHRFILFDMASTEPLVEEVIRGFERRGMFEQVIKAERNHPTIIFDFVRQNLLEWAPYFAYIESDVVVEDTQPCWLEQMGSIMQQRPNLAMLGSAIDRRDFVMPHMVEHLRRDEDEVHWRSLLKMKSPERHQDVAASENESIFRPHNPAGRHLLLRTSALQQVGLAADAQLDCMLRAKGYETGIATAVRHRHLSLLHIYDYPDYDIRGRDQYMSMKD